MFESSGKFLCLPCGRISLRSKRLLSQSCWPYVVAMMANFVARFFSTLTFLPPGSFPLQGDIFKTFVFVSPFVEILRRTMWSVFKFENKQLKITKTAKEKHEKERKGSTLTKKQT